MKKLLLAIFLILAFAGECFGAWTPTASMTWEIQRDSTAGNVNGCGFDPISGTPGTNWSLYPTCRYSWKHGATGVCAQTVHYNLEDDLVCTNAAASICTSAALADGGTGNGTGFLASDVGNVIYFISAAANLHADKGTFAGRARIASVAGGAATLDRNITDGVGDATEIVATMGGACSINSTLDDDFFEQTVAGNVVYIKYNSSAYTVGEATSVAAAGTSALPKRLVGYYSTRTDKGVSGANDYRPTISTPTNLFQTTGDNWSVENIIFTTSAQTNAISISGAGSKAINVKATNTHASADKYALAVGGASAVVANCELSSTNGYALNSGTSSLVIGNYIHDSNVGILAGGASSRYLYNIIDTIVTTGISLTTYDYSTIAHNTFYCPTASKGTTAILGTSSINNHIYGNIFNGWVTAVTVDTLDYGSWGDYNDYFGNTNANSMFPAGDHDMTTDPGFTDADNGDFTVGTNMKAASFPGVFPGKLSTGYLDVGAVQRVEPAAGGGGGAWGF